MPHELDTELAAVLDAAAEAVAFWDETVSEDENPEDHPLGRLALAFRAYEAAMEAEWQSRQDPRVVQPETGP